MASFVVDHRASPVAQTVKDLSAMRETWIRSLAWEDPLEKEMATHSSFLAWRFPWTEEPGRLPSVGWQSWTRLSDLSLASGALGGAGFSSRGSQARALRLSTCAARASLLHSMWDLPRPGVEAVSPALAGRFFITQPPGKPSEFIDLNVNHL